MRTQGLVRRTYDSLALVALLNVLGVGALVGFLVNNGAITSETFRSMAMVVRGQGVVVPPDVVVGDAATEAARQAKASAASAEISESGLEALRLEAVRIKAELDQRLALNNSIMLRVMTERENFKREQQEAAQRLAVSQQKRENAGFKKQLAILNGLPPKLALQHLLDMGEPDEAARVLLELETPQAKKIVESAKRGDDMVKMEDILRRVRNVSPRGAEELNE